MYKQLLSSFHKKIANFGIKQLCDILSSQIKDFLMDCDLAQVLPPCHCMVLGTARLIESELRGFLNELVIETVLFLAPCGDLYVCCLFDHQYHGLDPCDGLAEI